MLNLVIYVAFSMISDEEPRDPNPTLLSMKDMLDNNLDISIEECFVKFQGLRQTLTMDNYFLVHRWTVKDLPYAFYTASELRNIKRVFGHPSVKATTNLIKRAKGKRLSKDKRQMLQSISEACTVCKYEDKKPRRFKLTVGSEELRFNQHVQIDTIFLEGKPVIHMVDEATHLCAAEFLPTQSTASIWCSIQSMWCLKYIGPPDHIAVDQGSAYTSAEMRGYMASQGITLRDAPIECPGSIGVVERYHDPLKAAYKKIWSEMGTSASAAECLKHAVYDTNTSSGPEGFFPTLLVFGALP